MTEKDRNLKASLEKSGKGRTTNEAYDFLLKLSIPFDQLVKWSAERSPLPFQRPIPGTDWEKPEQLTIDSMINKSENE